MRVTYHPFSDLLAPFLMKDAPQFVAALYKKVLELKTTKLMSASFTSAGTKKRVLEPETEGPSNGETGEKPPG